MKKWIKIIVRMIFFLLLIVALFFWLKSDFWQVKKISCRLNGQECPPALKAGLMRLFQAQNILFLSPKAVIEEVNKRDLGLSQGRVKKELPNTLVFQLEARKPRAAVVAGNMFYLVDQEGVLLEKTEIDPELPLVFINQLQALEIGEKFEQREIRKAVSLLVDLQLRLLKPEGAKIVSEKEIEIIFGDNVEAIVSFKKDIETQLDSLQFIFSRTKIEGKRLKRVDLRFDKPVITYE